MRAISVRFKDGISIVEEVDIKSYKDYYKYLECDCFDVAMNKDRTISAFVDDSGLLISDNPVCDYGTLGFYEPLAGNVVFAGGVDSDGDTLPLSEDISVMMVSNAIDLIGFTR